MNKNSQELRWVLVLQNVPVFIFHLNPPVSLFLGIYREVGWNKYSRELILLGSALSWWWMRAPGQISPLPCWGSSESYSTLSPRGLQWDWAPVAHSSNLLDIVPLLVAFSLSSPFPRPPLLFPWVTYQKSIWPQILVSESTSGRTQTKTQWFWVSLGVLSFYHPKEEDCKVLGSG